MQILKITSYQDHTKWPSGSHLEQSKKILRLPGRMEYKNLPPCDLKKKNNVRVWKLRLCSWKRKWVRASVIHKGCDRICEICGGKDIQCTGKKTNQTEPNKGQPTNQTNKQATKQIKDPHKAEYNSNCVICLRERTSRNSPHLSQTALEKADTK